MPALSPSLLASTSCRPETLNCRAIPETAWEHARRMLVFYFSRRHQGMDAEDLAQETLARLWSRDDYGFDREEDFLRVCYGFARLILQKGYREARKHAGEALNTSLPVECRSARRRDASGIADIALADMQCRSVAASATGMAAH